MPQLNFVDQLSNSISLNHPPRRIISIVPSQTELLFDLGLDEQIIGITKFCHHPAGKVEGKTKVGGTKKLDLDLIRSLKPDLIIGNKEENERIQITTLMNEFPVWMSDIAGLPQALQMIEGIGEIINKHTEAIALAQRIENNFAVLPKLKKPLRTIYLIWQKPYMAAGKHTFIADLMERCGFVNAVNANRYPQLTQSDLEYIQADVIMLSSEPYPFKQYHADALKEYLPAGEILLVDGEMFSWYGSRLLQSSRYFETLIENFNRLNS